MLQVERKNLKIIIHESNVVVCSMRDYIEFDDGNRSDRRFFVVLSEASAIFFVLSSVYIYKIIK